MMSGMDLLGASVSDDDSLARRNRRTAAGNPILLDPVDLSPKRLSRQVSYTPGSPGFRHVPSFPSLDNLASYRPDFVTVTPAFARAYLKGRRRLKAGAVKFPVVRNAYGEIVDCGNVYEWQAGVATRVLRGELTCQVATFVRNSMYDPTDPESSVFVEHRINGWSAADAAQEGSTDPTGFLLAGESSAQGLRRSMEDETVIKLDLNSVLAEDLQSAPSLSSDPLSFFAIYDGHGGSDASYYAARYLHYNIARSSSFGTGQDVVKAVEEAFRATEKSFLGMSRKEGLIAGTTACVMLVRKKTLFIFNLGAQPGARVAGAGVVSACEDMGPWVQQGG